MTLKDDLYQALATRGSFEVVSETVSTTQIRIVGRISKDRFNAWSMVIQELLKPSKARDGGWVCDVSKQYVLHGQTLRYGWRLIFQAPNVEAAIPHILEAIGASKPPPAVELQDYLLPGYKDGQIRGGVNARGKGVSSSLSPMVGPRAIGRIQNGGM